MPPSPVMKYVKIAGYIGFFVGSSGFLFRWFTRQRLRKTDYYRLAVVNVMEHKPLVKYLGQPLGFGNFDLTDGYNFSTTSEAKFKIPVKGSQRKGTMFLGASRDPSSSHNLWELTELQVGVDDRPLERVHVPIVYSKYDDFLTKTGLTR